MKDKELLRYAANEIRSLRKTVEIQSAKLEIVDVFAAALGLKRNSGAATVDIVWEIEQRIEQIESDEPNPQQD